MASKQKRSEVVRDRRSQRQTSSRGSKTKSSTTRRQMPPVVSRNVVGSPRTARSRSGDHHRGRKDSPRVYDVSLSTTGAEARLPTLNLPRPTWRILSFFLLIGFSFLFYYVWTLPQFNVHDTSVIVNGLNRVSAEELLEISGIMGKPVFLIDTAELELFLLENASALESIEVTIEPSGLVVIDVVERVPVIVWHQRDNGLVWWVDQNGMRFKALGESDGLIQVEADVRPPAPPAPPDDEEGEDDTEEDKPKDEDTLTTEEDDGQLMEAELVAGIMAIPDYVPEDATLVYDKTHGIGWEDHEHNWVVYFGKELDQMPLRLKVYQAIIDYLSDKNNQPVMISIEYIYAPYYRMEP